MVEQARSKARQTPGCFVQLQPKRSEVLQHQRCPVALAHWTAHGHQSLRSHSPRILPLPPWVKLAGMGRVVESYLQKNCIFAWNFSLKLSLESLEGNFRELKGGTPVEFLISMGSLRGACGNGGPSNFFCLLFSNVLKTSQEPTFWWIQGPLTSKPSIFPSEQQQSCECYYWEIFETLPLRYFQDCRSCEDHLQKTSQAYSQLARLLSSLPHKPRLFVSLELSSQDTKKHETLAPSLRSKGMTCIYLSIWYSRWMIR